jgi:hypothetical protein
MRRLGNILDRHLSDLGGEQNVSHAERTLADRAAMLTLLAELQENAFLRNGTPAVELDKYLHVNTALTRILLALGLKRRAKPIGPTLGDLLREDLAEREQEVTAEGEGDLR